MNVETWGVVRVRLTPRGGRAAIMRVEDGVVYARVAAPPVEGAANKALTELIGKAAGVRKSAVTIRTGATSRDKVLAVEGISTEEAYARIGASADSP